MGDGRPGTAGYRDEARPDIPALLEAATTQACTRAAL